MRWGGASWGCGAWRASRVEGGEWLERLQVEHEGLHVEEERRTAQRGGNACKADTATQFEHCGTRTNLTPPNVAAQRERCDMNSRSMSVRGQASDSFCRLATSPSSLRRTASTERLIPAQAQAT